jgi:subtilisin family serine protease
MPRDREHLALPEYGQPLGRRRRPAPQPTTPRNRPEHGRKLIREVDVLVTSLQEKRRDYPAGFNPANIFRLALSRQGDLDENALTRMGLRLLAKDPRRALVVSTDDAQLGEIRDRLLNYSGQIARGAQYGELDAVENISPLTAADRTGSRLQERPLQQGETPPLDIEVWHTGMRTDCERFLRTVEAVLQRHNLRTTDRWIGTSICVARARLNDAALHELLEMPEVKEVDRPARPAFEHVELFQADVANLDIANQAAPDLVGIVVLDSGVTSQHPLIAPPLGDAQVFPDAMAQRILNGPQDGTQEGHGTGVCGIAAYGDLLAAYRARRFVPTAQLFSGRVTDDNNEYDEDILLESQLEQAITYFLDHYPQARIVNISLGDESKVYADGYQTRFAAAIDDLAYRFAGRGILIVVSSGNFNANGHLPNEQLKERYPGYLLELVARLIDPATAALAVTVGGISIGPIEDRHWNTDVRIPIAGEPGFPSPFTRSGKGIDGGIKPDVVEAAGDWVLDRQILQKSGVVTTAKNFTQGQLLVARTGTSFAAPKVANLAAQLMRKYPGYTSNLIRALVAHSAQVPNRRPQAWNELEDWNEDIMRVYGYGQPSLERALDAAQNEPWLLHDGQIQADTVRLFELPELPDEFLSERGRRVIRATLAFDPPTRPTRKDSYLGFTMDFAIYRNVDATTLADAYRSWDRNEREQLEDGVPPGRTDLASKKINLKPSSQKRNNGTLQSAWVVINSRGWKYDQGTPLYLAVVCQRTWAPAEITQQRFAVVMSLFHDKADLDLHARLRQRVQLFVRERVRL